MAEAVCDSCNTKILFIVCMNNAGRKPKRMPLNPEPDEAGNVAVRVDGTGTRIGRVLGKGQKALPGEVLYTPHFATCKRPNAHRRRRSEARRAAGQPAPRRGLAQGTLL